MRSSKLNTKLQISQVGCSIIDTPNVPAVKLDTLAQLRKRRQAKVYTLDKVKELIALADRPNSVVSPLQKSYKLSFWCCNEIEKHGDKITSKYCKQRWCFVCNRIRTAKLINAYKPVFEEISDLRFVTLTCPNVPADMLHDELERLKDCFTRIKDRLRKQGVKIRGVRKTEITYSQEREDYHPHFHILMEGALQSERLVQEWLKENSGAESWCQDNKEADGNSLVEIFKYVSKIKDNTAIVNDTIFQAVAGKRLVQAFGDVKQVSEDIEKEDLIAQADDTLSDGVYIWNDTTEDWYSMATGESILELIADSVPKAFQLLHNTS